MSDHPGDPPRSESPTRAQQRVTIDTLALHSVGGDVRDDGPNAVMYAWFQLFKTAQIHAIDNQALSRPVQAFADLSARVVARDGHISLQAKDGTIFLNSNKLRLTTDEYVLAGEIIGFFKERGMGGFTIDGPLDTETVRTLLKIFIYAPTAERSFESVANALRASGAPFRINKPLGVGLKSRSEVVLERRGYTFLTYSKLAVLYRSLLADEKSSASRRQYLIRKIARTMQALVDICIEDDHTFLDAAAIKSGESYASQHAANVAVLSIALGDKVGFNKIELADLGMAALFADLGLRECGTFIQEKPAPLDFTERASVELHPIRTVQLLLTQKTFTKTVLSQIVVAFEHHRHLDGTGYPKAQGRPDLFSRIVMIADVYDSLTTLRPWRRAYLPDEALGMMVSKAGPWFDTALLKIFVRMVGLYPVGTLVRLDSGEIGVVIYGGGEGERISRPVVILLSKDGKPQATVDLTERAPEGHYVRSIVASEDPTAFGVNPSGLLTNIA
ncbi:MAG TPA: HD domain-containing phosphohydrolase [Thermoanaerobaculia bacterium]|nr:HD domain-containing phosphohydrolase [Thermoanaerobaculia bacterium]